MSQVDMLLERIHNERYASFFVSCEQNSPDLNSQTVMQNTISEMSRIPRTGFIIIQLNIAMDMCKSGATPTSSTHYLGNEPALLKEQDRSREGGGSRY